MSRLKEAVHRQVPQLRYGGRGTGGGRSCATVNEDASAHGFNQRPQVVGYLERNALQNAISLGRI